VEGSLFSLSITYDVSLRIEPPCSIIQLVKWHFTKHIPGSSMVEQDAVNNLQLKVEIPSEKSGELMET
jgi:hypothetical protein